MCDDPTGDWSNPAIRRTNQNWLKGRVGASQSEKTRTAIYWQSSTLFTLGAEFEGVFDSNLFDLIKQRIIVQ